MTTDVFCFSIVLEMMLICLAGLKVTSGQFLNNGSIIVAK